MPRRLKLSRLQALALHPSGNEGDFEPVCCTSHDIEMWASDGTYERAEDGDPAAQFEVGQMYHLGRGLKKDPKEAAVWYRKAAERGHAEAWDLLEVVSAEVKSAP